jgi:hypothetical protein
MATKKRAAKKPARKKPRPSPKKASPKRAKRPTPKRTTSTKKNEPSLVKALRGHVFDVLVDADASQKKHAKAVAAALRNFREQLPEALLAAEGHVFLYYLDCKGSFAPGHPEHVEIARPADVWNHVELGGEATVGRRDADGKIYVSLECSCDWEQEHGLQIVLEEGLRVNKVGPFDGHPTNADAYDDPRLQGVVYRATGGR